MDIPIPTNVSEVEQLIESLYAPDSSSPAKQRIQEIIQHVQKSPDGWQLSQALAASPSNYSKFYGALTVIVKMNTESVSDATAQEILENILSWLIGCLDGGTAAFVVQKFCAALVTHYLRYSHLWPLCIQHVVRCLGCNSAATAYSWDAPGLQKDAVHLTNSAQGTAAAYFVETLAEEMGKVDLRSPDTIALHERFVSNCQDYVALARGFLDLSNESVSLPARKEIIKGITPWVTYAHRAAKTPLTTDLRTLVPSILECVTHDDLYEESISVLTDTLEGWDKFCTPDHVEAIYSLCGSGWGLLQHQKLCKGDLEEGQGFGLFLLAFANTQLDNIMDVSNSRSVAFLDALGSLLKVEAPVVDDMVFQAALEFWSCFVENASMELPSDSCQWDQAPMLQIRDAISSAWRKLQYPDSGAHETWDSEEFKLFNDMRRDLMDLLQCTYTLSGLPLLCVFADSTLQALERTDWAEVEVSMFCLGALSDCLSEGDGSDEVLAKVFGSRLFTLLQQSHSSLPTRVRRTGVSLIESFSDFFARNSQSLGSALNLLFTALEDAEDRVAYTASKSIERLCSSCSVHLTSEVFPFIDHYKSLRGGQKLGKMPEEKVVSAIATVIQSIKDPATKAAAFERLYALVNEDVQTSLELRAYKQEALFDSQHSLLQRAYDANEMPSEPVSSLHLAVAIATRALHCLHSIAKGLQSPAEDAELLELEPQVEDDPSSGFPNLEQVQMDIMGSTLARLKDSFSEQLEIVELLCSVLRAGFSETEPGPFVFPPPLVVGFITSKWNSHTGTVVNTACAFLSSCSMQHSTRKQYRHEVLCALLPWVFDLLRQCPNFEEDIELSQHSVEFVQRALVAHPSVVMSQPPDSIEFFFTFALQLLSTNEPLLKLASAEFWTNFLRLESDDGEAQAAIDHALNLVGAPLAQALVKNYSGEALRTQLDKLSNPLRRLVVRHPKASQWLEAALQDQALPNDRVSATDKAVFLKKIVSLRGSRATNQVVKEFWCTCRGLVS